jgi:uncharacterized damage-inducible protein DinB
MASFLDSLFSHVAWADSRIIAVLTTTPNAAQIPDVLRLLGHVVAAERVWLLRLRGEQSSDHPIWPEWTLPQIAAAAADNASAFGTLVAHLTDEGAARIVEYRNSQGVAFRTAVGDILMHVALHGSYHRGQIAMALRANGIAPVNTDYITYVRELSA